MQSFALKAANAVSLITVDLLTRFPGDPTGGGPPVPIPNTEVKPARAEDTWALGPGKIGRCQG